MEGEGRPTAIPHISALDGARGLAVAGVLLFHGGHLLGGYLGVDFFFTLSGFLITSLLLAESTRTGGVGLGGFWARRARRLLPALAVLVVGVAAYAATIATPDQLGQIRGDAFATLGYVANWHEIFSHTSYFALFSEPSPLNHTWSLAIEEQFYVIWPLAFVGLLAWWKRSAPKAVLATSLVLAAASSALMIGLYDPNHTNRVYFGTDTRAAAILFGVALAAALAIYGPVTKRNARIALEGLGLTGAAGLAIAWTRLDGQSPTLYRGGFLLCALAATAIIAAAVHPERGPIARALSIRPFVALGWISYGVYLYHWPIDVFLDQKRVGYTGWPLFAVQTAVTLAIAAVSYRIIEQPIRHGAVSSMQMRKLTPVIAIGLVAAIFVGTLGAKQSDQLFLPAQPVHAATVAFDSAPPGSRRVMIVGNSVAAFVGYGLQRIHTDPPLAVFNGSVLGCTFPLQIPSELVRRINGALVIRKLRPCHPTWETEVIKRFKPNVVFWMWADPEGVGTHREIDARPCTPSYDALYEQDLRKEIARLGAGGAHVVVTTEAYLRVAGVTSDDRATACQNHAVRAAAAATRAQLVDLFSYVCPHGTCRTTQGGATLRPDGLHYKGRGGEIIAEWLIDQVGARG